MSSTGWLIVANTLFVPGARIASLRLIASVSCAKPMEEGA
jgi:hypothetical protein